MMLAEHEQQRPVVEKIHVFGMVQGVGLRPFIWRLAHACDISGRVVNDSEGVSITAWGNTRQLDDFVSRLAAEAPPAARIDVIQRQCIALANDNSPPDFTIADSHVGNGLTDIAADVASCPACQAEILDPDNRRYRYPFTTCTDCGPRYSIIDAMPYDRPNTVMSAFDMCPRCRNEYADPDDRRYHAQTNACPDCGPQCWLEDRYGSRVENDHDGDSLTTTARLLQEGAIIAIKGLGGFHLACDAANGAAIARLRHAKQRPHKALALMARDLAMVRNYAAVDGTAVRSLSLAAAPIVVLPANPGNELPALIAPGLSTLGFMLPSTPLHHLLMQELARPLVMTSGNRHNEPLVIDNEVARRQLSAIADYLLLHDRDIRRRVDDSVIRSIAGAPRMLRRARGYAPHTIALPAGFDHDAQVLAMGGQQKTTFCLIRQGRAILSPHIGDLGSVDTYRDYQRQLNDYQQLFAVQPTVVAVDRHPDYLSTRLGRQYAENFAASLHSVQHHHAHIAAVMVEHGLLPDTPPLLGIALDGSGYGDDGTVWGGEFLLADYRGFSRVARFQPVPMPGGSRSVREPWLNTYAHLASFLGWDSVVRKYPGLESIRFIRQQSLTVLQTMVERHVNSPLTSSAGRLFDAVAAFIGVRRQMISYEGQAAVELEALAVTAVPQRGDEAQGYGYRLADDCIDWTPLWSGLLDDAYRGVTARCMALRFHQTVIAAVSDMALRLCTQHRVDTVVLSGGVFQNRLLSEGVRHLLQYQGLNVLLPSKIPAHDGGIALGQAAIALVANT